MNELIDIRLSRSRQNLVVEISLAPQPESDQSPESVRVILDGILLNPPRDSLPNGKPSCLREFQEMTQWIPGHNHHLVVIAKRQDGRESHATLSWTD